KRRRGQCLEEWLRQPGKTDDVVAGGAHDHPGASGPETDEWCCRRRAHGRCQPDDGPEGPVRSPRVDDGNPTEGVPDEPRHRTAYVPGPPLERTPGVVELARYERQIEREVGDAEHKLPRIARLARHASEVRGGDDEPLAREVRCQ